MKAEAIVYGTIIVTVVISAIIEVSFKDKPSMIRRSNNSQLRQSAEIVDLFMLFIPIVNIVWYIGKKQIISRGR